MKKTIQHSNVYRIPPSFYWGQYWDACLAGIIASFQLVMSLGIAGMEIGNAVVDLYRANVYSGFWAFPFIIAASIATYATVCMGKTQTKAIVALILQSISIFVLLVVIGFLIAFMASNFTLCLGFQCYQNSTTFASYLNDTYLPYSSYNYTILKRAFIVSELVCSFVYIVFAVMYILLFIRCLKKLPKTPPVALAVPQTSPAKIHMTSHTPRTTTHVSNISSIGQLPSAKSSLTVTNPSAPNSPYYRAQKVCPNCKHVSPYVPEKNIVECPNCHYQSPYVEHAQQS